MDAVASYKRFAVAAFGGHRSPLVVAPARATSAAPILGYLIAAILAGSPAALGDELLVFTRPGCSPCENAKAALAADPSITTGFTVTHVDTRERPEEARRYRVSSVPVFVVVRDGREIRRRAGFTSGDELRDWLSNKSRRRSRR
jgi:glutaredoxin